MKMNLKRFLGIISNSVYRKLVYNFSSKLTKVFDYAHNGPLKDTSKFIINKRICDKLCNFPKITSPLFFKQKIKIKLRLAARHWAVSLASRTCQIKFTANQSRRDSSLPLWLLVSSHF